MVGKRLVAMWRLSSRWSRIAFAISRICVFLLSGVFVVGGVVELVGALIVERRGVRSVCTKEEVCSVAPLTSSFHWVSDGCAIGIWKRIERA